MSTEDKFKKIIQKPYSMTYTCPNCHQEYMEMFEFGEVASQGTCPHCGVSPNQVRGPRYRRDDMDKVFMKVVKK